MVGQVEAQLRLDVGHAVGGEVEPAGVALGGRAHDHVVEDVGVGFRVLVAAGYRAGDHEVQALARIQRPDGLADRRRAVEVEDAAGPARRGRVDRERKPVAGVAAVHHAVSEVDGLARVHHRPGHRLEVSVAFGAGVGGFGVVPNGAARIGVGGLESLAVAVGVAARPHPYPVGGADAVPGGVGIPGLGVVAWVSGVVGDPVPVAVVTKVSAVVHFVGGGDVRVDHDAEAQVEAGVGGEEGALPFDQEAHGLHRGRRGFAGGPAGGGPPNGNHVAVVAAAGHAAGKVGGVRGDRILDEDPVPGRAVDRNDPRHGACGPAPAVLALEGVGDHRVCRGELRGRGALANVHDAPGGADGARPVVVVSGGAVAVGVEPGLAPRGAGKVEVAVLAVLRGNRNLRLHDQAGGGVGLERDLGHLGFAGIDLAVAVGVEEGAGPGKIVVVVRTLGDVEVFDRIHAVPGVRDHVAERRRFAGGCSLELSRRGLRAVGLDHEPVHLANDRFHQVGGHGVGIPPGVLVAHRRLVEDPRARVQTCSQRRCEQHGCRQHGTGHSGQSIHRFAPLILASSRFLVHETRISR